MARKTKLTPTLQAGIVKALAVGATHEQAYGAMGLSKESFYKWLRFGEEGRAPYVDFLDAVKKAEQKASIGWLDCIEKAARRGQWQAAAWKLERRYPKTWGRNVAPLDEDSLARFLQLWAALSTQDRHTLQGHTATNGTTSLLLPHEEPV